LTPEELIYVDEKFCICEKWVIEVEPGIWAHEDHMLVCTPAQPMPLTYTDEVA
jgi:hypothetical protein